MKKYSVKVFDETGTSGGFLENLTPELLKSPLSFRSRINGGLGELVLDLNLPFDNFDGHSIDLMNVVDVYCIDDANPRGRRIYRGFISRFEPYIEREEGVRITCLGLGRLLTLSHYKNGSSFSVTHTAQDPQAIYQAIIDHFSTIYPSTLLSYAGVTQAVGTNVTVTLADLKWEEAIRKTVELAGAGWFWKVDADGKAHLKPKPSSATHTFTLGKDIDSIVAPKDGEKIVNDVQVRYTGGATYDYSDVTSITSFGRRTEIISESDIGNLTTATQRGQKRVNDHKDEKVKATIVLNPNYDLESIQVGQTCKVANLRKGFSFISDNAMIVGLTYEPDRVTVELEEASADFGIELFNFIG